MFADRTNWRTQPNRLAACLAERRRLGLAVIDLTESNPTRCGLSPNGGEVLARFLDPRGLRYEPHPKGLPAAREAISAYHAGRGVRVPPERLIVASGTSECYSWAFRLLANPGDEILAPAPSYPLFDFLADINDVRLVSYPLAYDHGWSIDLDGLWSRISSRTRAILVVSPNNPTGSYLKSGERDELAALARRHGLALIADEVFRDYPWTARAAAAPSLLETDGCLAFTFNGLSKICALPQMKLAWMAASGPAELAEDALSRLEVIADTYLSVSTPLQWAAVQWLGEASAVQTIILARVRSNLEYLDSLLAGSNSPVTRLESEGGWYAALRVPNTRSDEEWALGLLQEHGVYVHPGHFFEFPRDGYLIVSLISEEAEFRTGMERLIDTIR